MVEAGAASGVRRWNPGGDELNENGGGASDSAGVANSLSSDSYHT
jgi:hypothetical protein